MSMDSLRSYAKASRDLKKMAVGMSAEDIKTNSKFVIESAQINEIPETGKVQLNVDQNGVAHIPIIGMLTNTVTPSAAFEGNSITTYNFITESVRLAELDSSVKEIKFNVNTGGGDVDGVEEAVISIANATKPSTAIVHSSAQSAGILLASQADKIIAAGKMSMFGSVGIAAEFKDRSVANEKAGVKSIILTSTDAPEKRLDITTDKGQELTIKLMDEVHAVMVGHIARGRNKTSEFVNKNFGQGGTMTAERALAVGMIDAIEGLESLSNNSNKTFSIQSQQPNKEKTMDEKEFKALLEANPEFLAAHDEIVAQTKIKSTSLTDFLASSEGAKTEYDTAIAEAKTEASTEIKSGKISKSDAKFALSLVKNYSASTQDAVEGYFCGENDLKTVKMLASNEDMMNEKLKSLGVQGNQGEATPAGGVPNQKEADVGKTVANAKTLSDAISNSSKVI